MKVYADTNFLVRLFLDFDTTESPWDLLKEFKEKIASPLPVPPLLRYECLNAINRMVFESRNSGQLRVTAENAAIAINFFEEEFLKGTLLKPTSIPWNELSLILEPMVAKYTQKYGFRTYDMIHVASALALNSEAFWSYDIKARKLAELVGLQINSF
jgi:predicted nucleic acid-binding protein